MGITVCQGQIDAAVLEKVRLSVVAFIIPHGDDIPLIIYPEEASKIHVMNYSGHVKVIYTHEGDGSTTASYRGGDFRIKKAAAGSGIVVSTNNAGIDMNNDDAVWKALNADGELCFHTAPFCSQRFTSPA